MGCFLLPEDFGRKTWAAQRFSVWWAGFCFWGGRAKSTGTDGRTEALFFWRRRARRLHTPFFFFSSPPPRGSSGYTPGAVEAAAAARGGGFPPAGRRGWQRGQGGKIGRAGGRQGGMELQVDSVTLRVRGVDSGISGGWGGGGGPFPPPQPSAGHHPWHVRRRRRMLLLAGEGDGGEGDGGWTFPFRAPEGGKCMRW